MVFNVGDLVTAVNNVSPDMMWRAYRVTNTISDDVIKIVDVLTNCEFFLHRHDIRKIKTFQEADIGDFVLVRQLNSEDNLQPMLVGVKCEDRFDVNDRTPVMFYAPRLADYNMWPIPDIMIPTAYNSISIADIFRVMRSKGIRVPNPTDVLFFKVRDADIYYANDPIESHISAARRWLINHNDSVSVNMLNRKGMHEDKPKNVFERFKFGIELEGIIEVSPHDLKHSIRAKGIECVVDANTTSFYSDAWKITSDSSIDVPFDGVDSDEDDDEYYTQYGVEIVSPPLKGSEGVAQVRKVFEVLRNSGWDENDSCGLHVHVDASELNTVRKFREFIRLMFLAEAEIMQQQRPARLNKRYCARMYTGFAEDITCLSETTADISPMSILKRAWYRDEDVDTGYKYQDSRYRGLNLHSYWYRGTVEFRYFNTPLNADECLAIVNLCLNLVRAGADTDRELIQEYYKKHKQAFLKRKVLNKLFVDEEWREHLPNRPLTDRMSLGKYTFEGRRLALMKYLQDRVLIHNNYEQLQNI